MQSKLFALANTKLGWRLTYNTVEQKWLETWIVRNCEHKLTLSTDVSWHTMLLPELVTCRWHTVSKKLRARQFATTSDKHYTTDLSLPGTCLNANGMYDNVIVNNAMSSAAVCKLCRYIKPNGMLLIGGGGGIDIATVPKYMVLLHSTLVNPDNGYTFTQYTKPL